MDTGRQVEVFLLPSGPHRLLGAGAAECGTAAGCVVQREPAGLGSGPWVRVLSPGRGVPVFAT